MKHIAAVVLGCLAWMNIAEAASFDCTKATLAIEKTICSDDNLSKLDESLGKAFQQALEKSEDRQKATKAQRQWLRSVRNSCQDTACLEAVYLERIRELSMVAEQVPVEFTELEWLDSVVGNYYGGPSISKCAITLPGGKRRCNCLSIKKQLDGTAKITFDRHDSHEGYVCSGKGIAKIVGENLVLCPEGKRDDAACLTITRNHQGLTFHHNGKGGYCGLGATIDGMNFRYRDRIQSEVICGP